jgi:uncharacterized protein with HEPN domain
MTAPKDDRVYLWDMLTAARAVALFARGRTLAEYEADLLLRSAVERQIEIIGEAARRVSAEFQAAHPVIPCDPFKPSGMCWPTTMGKSNTSISGESLRGTFLS